MSNREVATELSISIKTVQFHLSHIYAKLGINIRGELAAQFRDQDTSCTGDEQRRPEPSSSRGSAAGFTPAPASR
jgi:hypothetical protein